jgi:hypothetical protein
MYHGDAHLQAALDCKVRGILNLRHVKIWNSTHLDSKLAKGIKSNLYAKTEPQIIIPRPSTPAPIHTMMPKDKKNSGMIGKESTSMSPLSHVFTH